MKKILSIMVLLAGIVSLVACSDDDPTYTAPAQLSLKSADAFYEAAGGTGTIVVNSTESITATSDAQWLTAAVSGNTVTLTVAANNALEGRSANVVLKSATAVTEVNVTQRGIIYGVNEDVQFSMADTLKSIVRIPVAHTADVNVTSLTDWLSASFNSETGRIEVVATASNDAEAKRVGYVALQTGNVKDTLAIVQDALLFKVDTAPLAIEAEGGSQKIAIEHSRPVTVETDAEWISAELNEKGTALNVTVAANEGEERQGTIALTSVGITKTITVAQKAAEAGDPQGEDENPLLGTFTFYWIGENTYNLGDFTIEEYTGEDAEEGDVVLKGFYVPGNEIYGYYETEGDVTTLYIFANQALGTLTDPDEGDYGNILQSTSGANAIAFTLTEQGFVSTDLKIMATDPAYTEGWWWEIPAGGTSIIVKGGAASSESRAAAPRKTRAKSRQNLPTSLKLFSK